MLVVAAKEYAKVGPKNMNDVSCRPAGTRRSTRPLNL